MFQIGETVRLTTRVVDTVERKLSDPSAISFLIKNPVTGAETTYVYGTDSNVGRLSVGVYFADVVPTVSGKWAYRIETTGAYQGAHESTFDVLRSRFS